MEDREVRKQQGVGAISSSGIFPYSGGDGDTAGERTPVLEVGARNGISNREESDGYSVHKAPSVLRQSACPYHRRERGPCSCQAGRQCPRA